MTELADVLEGIEDFSIEGQEPVVMKWVEDKGYKLGDVMNAFRLTLVGEGKGPVCSISLPSLARRKLCAVFARQSKFWVNSQ